MGTSAEAERPVPVTVSQLETETEAEANSETESENHSKILHQFAMSHQERSFLERQLAEANG